MEIISGNPNVNKSLTDLGMREDSERLAEKQYSRYIKRAREERDGGWAKRDR